MSAFKEATCSVTATSPSSATTAVAATTFKSPNINTADRLRVDATLTGGTGGTLDVYLQRRTGTDAWVDWVHFPQLAAGAAAIRYTAMIDGRSNALAVVGGGSTASPGVALAANNATNVLPGDEIRVVFVAGASTSAGASQTILITPFSERT